MSLRYYHDYGFDMAGFEGRDRVLSCVDGVVIDLQFDQGWVVVEDDQGILFRYAHLDEIQAEIKKGTQVKRGQQIGILGKKGFLGNFSHLHVGVYLSKAYYERRQPTSSLNLYPWMVAANQRATGAKLYAVARPHHALRVGERLEFDGTKSIALGAPITSYRWEFHDGTVVGASKAEKTYHKLGTYMATLWVGDDRGLKDVDFCKVRVYSKDKVEDVMLTIFITYTPSDRVRVGQPVYFRFWPQGKSVESIQVDFGDGTVLLEYTPYSEITHSFTGHGIHIVTATASAENLPIMQKIKIIVQE